MLCKNRPEPSFAKLRRRSEEPAPEEDNTNKAEPSHTRLLSKGALPRVDASSANESKPTLKPPERNVAGSVLPELCENGEGSRSNKSKADKVESNHCKPKASIGASM